MTTARELRNMSIDELLGIVHETRRALFNLKVRDTTKELKNVAEIQKQKKELARALTVLREKGIKF